jgi:polygalacturonase
MVQIISVFSSLVLLASLVQAAVPSKTCVVQKSKTDDALTIIQAFKDCQAGGTVVFSKGATYYPKSLIKVENLNNVNVQFLGNMVLPNYNTKFVGGSAYLEIWGNNIHFDGYGKGTIIGSGQQWWDAKNNKGPTVFRITAKNSVFRNFRILDAPTFHMGLTGCENVIVEKIYMHSVSRNNNFAYNTDAYGVSWSKNMIFRDSHITNGDDCAAINGEVSNITVSNVQCNGSHGFSVSNNNTLFLLKLFLNVFFIIGYWPTCYQWQSTILQRY